MDTGDNHSQDMFNILPPSLQSRMPDLLKRSFATLPLRRSRTTPPIPQRPSSSAGTASSYSDSDATLFSYSSSEASSTSARCSEQSVPPYSATSRDMSFTPPSEDQFAMDDPSSEYRRYPQLARLLQAAMEMDQSQSQSQNRMLELLQAQSRQPDPSFSHIARLPRDFNVSSHDAADQKWSPAGIKWRYARQGALFATQASNEMHDAAFERSAFIDGVAYYLRACPDELTEWETAKLASAAPWLVGIQQAARGPAGPGLGALAGAGGPGRGAERGLLFHLVQWAVAALVVLAYGLWCSLLTACRVGAHLEREYHVSDWLMRTGFDTVNFLGRQGVSISETINSLSDGRMGQVVGGVASWTVDSVAGGIQEGYGRGMRRIQEQNSARQTNGGPGGLVEGLGRIIELSRLASMPLGKQ